MIASGDLLTTRQLAELLQVTPRAVQKWRTQGKLPEPLTLGRSVRYRRADIEPLIRGTNAQPAEAKR